MLICFLTELDETDATLIVCIANIKVHPAAKDMAVHKDAVASIAHFMQRNLFKQPRSSADW